MNWRERIVNKVKSIIPKRHSRINMQPAEAIVINVNESMDFEANAAKNRIWYRGDSLELSQLYEQLGQRTTLYNFWASKSSPGMEMRKIHTGIPSIIVDTLTNIVLTDMNDIQFEGSKEIQNIWNETAKDNELNKVLENAVKEVLYIGDGAFKITFDTEISEYPIIEFYSGDKVEFNIKRGRIREVIFKTTYVHNDQCYILHETYGYGYIKNRLTKNDKEVHLNSIPETKSLSDYHFSTYKEDSEGTVQERGLYSMAVPFMVFKSSKYAGRGKSIFDAKTEAFDSVDEVWSQWMDALRAGRTKEYIPDNLLPRNPETGAILKPNAFDNRYIKTDSDVREGVSNKIELEQPVIPHESYTATYCTALDLCLQGLISPSTIGIDVKKLDNADAQREKEKATLYTRNAIVETLTDDLKALANSVLNAYVEFNGLDMDISEADVTFGEYANPSFESQIETVGKGKTQGIMSIEACVDELYGDTKDKSWKEEEVARLKAEQGIAIVEEPAVSMKKEEFVINNPEGVV